MGRKQQKQYSLDIRQGIRQDFICFYRYQDYCTNNCCHSAPGEPVGFSSLVIHSNKHYFLKVNVCFLSQYYRRKYDVEFVWIKQFLLKQQL